MNKDRIISSAERSRTPDWNPKQWDKADRAKWLHEWFALQTPKDQARLVNKISPCCSDLMGGSYRGSLEGECGVTYEVSCTNCGKLLSKKTVKHASQTEPDLKELAAGERKLPYEPGADDF